MMLSAAEVQARKFSTSTFPQGGYDSYAVDQLLDRVTATLTRLESGQITGVGGAPLLGPDDIFNQRFPITKLRGGYAMEEVDSLLDEVASTLTQYVERALRGELSSVTSSPSESSGAPSQPPLASTTVSRSGARPESGLTADSRSAETLDPGQTPAAVLQAPDPEPPEGPPADALTAGEFLRELQYTRATMFGDARESLTFRTSDGSALHPLRIERTDDGLVVHLG